MRGVGKILFTCSIVTAVLLLYVHERVEMLRISYQIQKKSSQLSHEAEEYRRITFEVAQMRSPQNLEKRLEELSLPLTLPKSIQVLRVPPEPPIRHPISPVPFHVPSRNFLDFLGQWIQVAQARTDQ